MLTEVQLYLIAVAASVIVFIIRQVSKRTGKPIPEAVLTVGVYVVSFLLALVFKQFTFPPVPACVPSDPGACASGWLEYLTAFLQSLGGYVALAALVYQALLKRILEINLPTMWKRIRMAMARA